MESLDLSKIKYYPDRFYISLDGFETDFLTAFLAKQELGQQQAIFIHEYYHYLTNIATPSGIRQFEVNFIDRFKLSTILTSIAHLDAYPLVDNKIPKCQPHIQYWNDVIDTLDEDDIDRAVVKESQQTQTANFSIEKVERVDLPKTFVAEGKEQKGCRKMIRIHTQGLLTKHSFYLTFGAMDEFLSSAIDEYLFENDLAAIDHRMLSNRPFYPYGFFDELLAHYGIRRATAQEKIMIAYTALDAQQPPVALINILEGLQNGGWELFQQNPEAYLKSVHTPSPQHDPILDYIYNFDKLCFEQNRVHIAQAILYFLEKFISAKKLKEQDFLFFIRPFFATGADTAQKKQQFIKSFAHIVNIFNPPVFLKDKKFYYFDNHAAEGESTLLLLATFEILESLRTNRIASRSARLKEKYTFPDLTPDCDNIENFTPPPIKGCIFRMALNEINLYGLYLQEQQRRQHS